MPWEWPIGALLAALIAFVTTPAGVSGAVLLLPVQVSALGVPSPSVTPTNLLFNVLAVPGGLLRFGREGRLFGPLTWLLVAGTLPGVVAGAVIRVEFLPGERATAVVAGAVLLPLGLWLLAGPRRVEPRRGPPGAAARRLIPAVSLVVGVVGGIYGIGGGSLLAPILLAAGMSAYQVAPATLAATFMTSVAGIATFEALQATQGGVVGPDWALGLWLGAGGFVGSYAGARMQRHLPETALRRLLGVLACAIAVRYLVAAGTSDTPLERASRGPGTTAPAALTAYPASAPRSSASGLSPPVPARDTTHVASSLMG
ncbi:MAG TPA: sulfite exporter TauE/SafE family protein [Miltoncostaeaceae bacterium]|nr:sulfite exporter TauE/SafE family protein [Miltoncostaeaceae bacterium]